MTELERAQAESGLSAEEIAFYAELYSHEGFTLEAAYDAFAHLAKKEPKE
jgi:hypothetical protein